MKQYFSRILMLIMVMSLVLAAALPAQAQNNWYRDGRVLDMRQGADLGGFAAKFNTASNATGVPVFVIIMGGSQLDGKYTDEVAQGIMKGNYDPSLAAGGDWLPYDAVVIAVAPDVKKGDAAYDYAVSTLSYAGAYGKLGNSALPGHAKFVGLEIAEKLDKALASDWQQAVLDAVQDIRDASATLGINTFTAPASNPPANQPINPPASNQRYTETPQKPVDLSWLLWLVVIVAIVVAIVFGFAYMASLISAQKEKQEKLRKARGRAVEAYRRIQAIQEGWVNRLKAVQDNINALRGMMSEEDLREAVDKTKEADQQFQAAVKRYQEYNIPDPSTTAEDADQYESWSSFLERHYNNMRQAADLLGGVESELMAMAKLSQNLESALAGVDQLIGEAAKVIGEISSEENGIFCKAANDLLSQATAKEKAARELRDQKQLKKALELANEAKNTAESARASALDEPVRLQQLSHEGSVYLNETRNLERHIADGTAVLAEVQQKYAEVNWQNVAKNPVTARGILADVNAALPQAAQLIKTGDLDEADTLLDQIHKMEQDCGWMIESIFQLRTQLEEAVKELAGRLEEAERSVAEAADYVVKNDLNLPEDAEGQIDEMKKVLNEIKADLQCQEAVCYDDVTSRIKAVDRKADDLLAQCKNAVDQMAKAQRSADEEASDATKAIKAADAYIDDHKSDVEEETKDELASAQELLAKAVKALDNAAGCEDGDEEDKLGWLRAAINNGAQAEEKAKDALQHAKDDVEEANKPAYSSSSSYGYGSSSGSTVIIHNSGGYSSNRRDDNDYSSSRPSTSSWSPSSSRPAYRPSSPSINSSRPSTTFRSSPSISSSRPGRG